MPKLPSNLDIALARNSLDFLVSLGQEIVSRANQIRAEFPDGTFDDDDDAGEPEELVPAAPTPAPKPTVKKKGRPKKPVYQSAGLSQALRDWPKTHDGKLVVREFKAANNFKPNSIDGVVAGLVRNGTFVRDTDEPGVVWSATKA